MFHRFNKEALFKFFSAMLIIAVSLAAINLTSFAQADQPPTPIITENPSASLADPISAYNVFIPQLAQDYPWISPFGIEATEPLLDTNLLLQRASDLQLGWARMGYQVSWAELQPYQGVTPNWNLLTTFETELRNLKAAGIHPVVIVKDAPDWALDPIRARDASGNLIACGAIAEQYFDEFADFMRQLVERYSTLEFNVHDWELGNEPDVDPTILQEPDSPYGCWGDINDTQYYGGFHYGRMLVSVAPAIKLADSRAQVWMGGLLLARPESKPSSPDGYPERFLRGVLAAGAGPSVDIFPYHWYATYWDFLGTGTAYDYDLLLNPAWTSWGGGTLGKARYMQQVMVEYGVNKPIVLNESGFGCKESELYCQAPDDRFYESQANHLVRFYARGLSEHVGGFFWYTLNGPGWRYTGLLDQFKQPNKAYIAFQYLSQRLRYTRYLYMVDYGPDIEAYAFRTNSHQLHILWAKEDKTVNFYVPVDKFIEFTDRSGYIIYDQSNPPPQVGSDYVLQAGFAPSYLTINP